MHNRKNGAIILKNRPGEGKYIRYRRSERDKKINLRLFLYGLPNPRANPRVLGILRKTCAFYTTVLKDSIDS